MTTSRKPIRTAGELPRVWRPYGRLALQENWTIWRSGSNHFRWQNPSGVTVTVSGSPHHGNRSIANTLADLRRLGLKVKH